MNVDKSLVDWFLDKVETHDSNKARDLKRFLRGSGMEPQQFFEEACRDKENLQQVVDELLIDHPPDRSASTQGAAQ